MGRNGKEPSAFNRMIELINSNVGKELTTEQLLAGKAPSCKDVATNYLYKFIKLGYISLVSGDKVLNPEAVYHVLNAFPPGYNSVVFMDELRLFNGKPAKYTESLVILNRK